ncbi:MAG: hypothetical protein M1825_002525 [Sarcosagium campestre]|nr:MAG: hypothetical protein M1825_002525 [Sarcosagium campestre]
MEIHEKCFTKAQGANVKYLQFGQDIKSLAQNLSQLRRVFERIKYERQTRYLPDHDDDMEQGLDALPELTGDFHRTLKDCDKILRDKAKFRRTAGFVENVQWHMGGVEKSVNSLRERVAFHSVKILLIVKPVEIKLLTDLEKHILDLRRDVREIRDILQDRNNISGPLQNSARVELPPITAELDRKFSEALLRNGPAAYVSTRHDPAAFPLKEGFDALVVHFEESTRKISSGADPNSQETPEISQYLNLLKSRWILQKIQKSPAYIESGQNSLWVKCMERFEAELRVEYRRFSIGRLVAPDAGLVALLPEETYTIWAESEAPELEPSATDEAAGEERILELDLPVPTNVAPGTQKSTVTVFRKSESELRIVKSTTRSVDDMVKESDRDYDFDGKTSRFIPVYALPDKLSEESTMNVLLCNSHGDTKWNASFNTEADIHKFQRAATGYMVRYDFTTVNWSWLRHIKSRFGILKPTKESGRGRIQIWEALPLPRIVKVAPAPNSPGVRPSGVDHRRQSSAPSAHTTLVGSTATSKSGMTSVVRAGNGKHEGTLLVPPLLPVMVIFTKYKERYTYIHILLDHKVQVSTTTPKGTVIIESDDKLSVKRHCADDEAEAGVNSWDLSLLRTPEHPKWRGVEQMTNTKWIAVQFPTVDAMDEFLAEYEKTIEMRSLDWEEYESIRQKQDWDANHPKRHKSPPTKSTGHLMPAATWS